MIQLTLFANLWYIKTVNKEGLYKFMNIFRKIYCRTFQLAFRVALPILPYREPEILESNSEVVDMLKRENRKHVFFVTDKNIRGLGITKALEETLAENNIILTVYDDVLPNPTISMVESALKVYKNNMCDCIIALGDLNGCE